MSNRSHRIDPAEYDGLSKRPSATVELESEAATRRIGNWVGRRATAGDVVGLVGALGAGKTTFVKGVVQGVDPDFSRPVTSPTYALIQEYETSPVCLHIDLYRLQGWGGLESIGYWDAVERRNAFCCVEWLDRIPGAWPGGGVIVELVRNSKTRTARIFADADWRRRLEDLDSTGIVSAQQ